MSESFIQPRRKKLLGSEFRWLFAIFVLLVLFMVIANIFLNHSIHKETLALQEIQMRLGDLELKEQKISEEIARLQTIEKFREQISTKNRLKKENVKNFFDLVPDDVVLEMAEFRKGTLRLKGVTESKESYLKHFQRSLDSLFARSSTSFKRRKDGRYDFKNISILEVK